MAASTSTTPITVTLDALRQVLGPVAWRDLSRTLGGLMQLRHERALLLLPHAITVR